MIKRRVCPQNFLKPALGEQWVMNEESICENPRTGRVHGPGIYPGSSAGLVLPRDRVSRRLIWSSRKPNDWEILVYKDDQNWEVCFFRWPLHHEHASGSSFETVKRAAEQRIRSLEARHLKGTKWI